MSKYISSKVESDVRWTVVEEIKKRGSLERGGG